jgi:putative transposase
VVPLVRRGEYDLWQRRFWEHRSVMRRTLRHVDYIDRNPVEHGRAANPFDWR